MEMWIGKVLHSLLLYYVSEYMLYGERNKFDIRYIILNKIVGNNVTHTIWYCIPHSPLINHYYPPFDIFIISQIKKIV